MNIDKTKDSINALFMLYYYYIFLYFLFYYYYYYLLHSLLSYNYYYKVCVLWIFDPLRIVEQSST